MITIENLSKSFGRQTLFDETGFRVNRRQRIGLVGKNGHGKTTLFKMIIGEEAPDSGNIFIPKNYRIGFVRQHIDFTEKTVLAEGMKGLRESEKDAHWKVEKILFGLGFSEKDTSRDPYEFSGGYRVRLNLAKVLVSDPDLMLLDEPTNYLDITSIRWLERFFSSWQREIILITHDRSFMDKVITHTVGIHRKKMRKIKGSTEKYYAQIAQDEEVYEKTRQNDEQKRKDMERFIEKFRAKARLANMVQSRVKTLQKKEKKEKLEKLKNLDFSFRYESVKSRYIMTAEGLNFSYEKDLQVIKNLSFSIQKNDRICIIGKNGKGKTTLLKLLSGLLTPDSGKIAYNPNVIKGVYEQTGVKSLVDSRTVADEILYSDKDMDNKSARNIAGAMMFSGDSALKKIEVLSGGEKSRVLLGKLLATPVNLLLLDEPTNHLDMDSSDALLTAVDNFEGAVVMVTHNEMFLHTLAEKLIVFQNEKVFWFEGSYSRFLEKIGWQEEEAAVKEQTAPKVNKTKMRQIRSQLIADKSRETKPIKLKIAEAEDRIEYAEKEQKRLNEKIMKAYETGDGLEIAELSQAIHKCQKTVDESFYILEKLTEELEEKNAFFEAELAKL